MTARVQEVVVANSVATVTKEEVLKRVQVIQGKMEAEPGQHGLWLGG